MSRKARRTQEAARIETRRRRIQFAAAGGALLAVLLTAVVLMHARNGSGTGEEPAPSELRPLSAKDKKLHARLFPRAGYRVFRSEAELRSSLKEVLVWEKDWTPDEERTLKAAVALIIAVEGKESPVGQDLQAVGSKNGLIHGIVPMEQPFAVGENPETRLFVDTLWTPITQCIHVPRGRLSFMVLVSSLFHETTHVRQAPDVATARGLQPVQVEVEAYERQIEFNRRLFAFMARNFSHDEPLPRWQDELRVINWELRWRIRAYQEGQAPGSEAPR